MAKLTPQQAREKHATRLKASTADIRRGVENVRVAPGVAAAAAQDKMRAKILESIDNGKWAQRVASVPLDEWKQSMIDKGVPRIAAGIDGAADKMEAFYDELFVHQDKLQAEVQRMPALTLDDSINRATAWIRGMSTFKRKA